MVAAPLQFLEQGVDGFRLRHEHGLAEELGPRLGPLARLAGEFRQEVLGVEDAQDIVAVAAVDGNPRVAAMDRLLDHLFPGERGGEGEHVGPRGHDLRDVGVAQLDHALDHLPRLFLEQALAMPFGDNGADVLLERFLVGGGDAAAGQAMQGRVDDVREKHQREQEEARAPQDRPGEKQVGIGP